MIEYTTFGFIAALLAIMAFSLLVIEQVDRSYKNSINLIKDTITIVMNSAQQQEE